MRERSTLEKDKVNRKGVALFYLSEVIGENKDTNLYRHRVLYEGKFTHPRDPSKWMVITKEHLQDAVRNFNGKVMDKVNAFWSHSGLDDPRNVAGEVVGLETGEDPKDKKFSLYSISRFDDPAALEYAKTNKGGVSLGMDHEYREHDGGKKVGLVVKHLALVPQGFIHKLGDWLPLPQSMHDAAVHLGETHGDGVIYLAEDEDKLEEELDDEKDDKSKDKDKDKPKPNERKEKLDLKELQDEAKKQGLNLLSAEDLKKLMTPEQIKTHFASFNLTEDEWKDPFAAVIKRVNSSEDAVKKVQAERAVDTLLQENKITPALKDTFVALYSTNKSLYDTMVAQLKPGAVNLTEEGKTEADKPGSGKVDTAKEISRYLALAEDTGIPVEGGKGEVSVAAQTPYAPGRGSKK